MEETPDGGMEPALAPVHAGSFTAVLKPARRIAGTAVDAATGKPVAGVEVLAWGRPLTQVYPFVPYLDTKIAMTDSEGRFAFPDMPKTRYLMMADPKAGSPF